MDFKKLFRKDDKAVSPVIGVILMVAITVILAAAIGSSVFSHGTAQSAPQANFNIKAVNLTAPGYVKVEHLGGDPIHFEDGSKIRVSASFNGGNSNNMTAAAADLGKMEPGSVRTLQMTGSGVTTINSGDTANIKITDVATGQLICDKEVRF